MRRRRSLAVPGVLLAAALAGSLLAGCEGDDETAASPTSSSAPSSSRGGSGAGPSTEPVAQEEDAEDGDADAPPFPADASPDTQDASSDAMVTVRDIRIGRQDGFDRIVFEVGGAGAPGWDVRYVDAAASQGSGDPVDVEGSAILRVTITGAGYPYDTGVEEFASADPLTAAGTEVVQDVVFDATYEGTTVAFAGTTGPAPFRVFALQNPARVVVDVRDAG
jgi:hypothetical protein